MAFASVADGRISSPPSQPFPLKGEGQVAFHHFVSRRIASSSPRRVSGYMRWFINCWTMEML